jgi:hypothetical protein
MERDVLIQALNSSVSLTEASKKLNLGKNLTVIKKHLVSFGLEENWPNFDINIRFFQDKEVPENFPSLVDSSRNYRDLARKLCWTPHNRTVIKLKRIITRLGLSTSHFTGNCWNKGIKGSAPRKYKTEEVFCLNSPISKIDRYYRKVFPEQICSVCSITDWLEKPITMHVDHKSGDRTDNRFENLRYLCPNCHQQTDTWGGKKRL